MNHPEANTAAATTADQAGAAPAASEPVATVTLETPIVRGKTTITVLQLRKPKAGALRGVNLAELLQLRAEAVMKVLPRITTPTLLAHDVEAMDPVDLIACASEVVDFLVPAKAMAKVRAEQQKALESLDA